MIRSLNTGVQGLRQYQTSLDAIGNNLANINTVAYKSARVDFADTLNQTLRAPTPDTATASGRTGMQVGNGLDITAIKNSFEQGAIKQTGVRTDLAIAGEGFFLVKDASTSEMFATRAGDFRTDKNGYLVTNSGHRVQGLNKLASAYTTAEKKEVGDLQIDAGKYMAEVSGVTIATGTEILTKAAGHGYTTSMAVKFSGTVPTADPEITNSTVMYVRADATNPTTDFTLHRTASDAAAGSNAVNFTAAGLAGGYTLVGGASISSFSVGGDGNINMLLNDGTSYVRGQVLVQSFNNKQNLMKSGGNLYSNLATSGALGTTGVSATATEILAGAAAPGASGLGTLQSGALELSNVDMAKSFANMITTQRAFQANARVISTSDEILQEMMQLKR